MDIDMKGWIDEELWKRIQKILPIVTIDILPLKKDDGNDLARVGLILRETADEGEKWCLIGGRLLYGEKLWEGVKRQIRITLGDGISISTTNEQKQPLYVAQYFSYKDDEFLRDPRQHTVGLTYALFLEGEVKPRDEALDFKWFSVNNLPKHDQFGFNHDILLRKCLELLKLEHIMF
ncbi:MAG: DUF4916 domain-containing protein [Nitrososphaerota archaeon]|jgi:ADP-ribose pyrophosphatase YjhB (NUDIX family)|nr:DUF4916 domain-containing protein [Nitrososphaerota archaeon]MDG7037649.1 DUF4916 domain-containing protein [Nitrososphaerota archaeon]